MYQTKLPKISLWAEDDRPREKFQQKGPFSLSDSELLAIFLNSGIPNKSAIDVAKELLAKAKNDLQLLDNFSINDYKSIKGIGTAKATTLLALIEFSKRKNLKNKNKKLKVSSASQVYEFLKYKMSSLNQEEFHLIMLNKQLEIIDSICIAKGNIDMVILDQRVLFKHCFDCYACNFIVAHNHPSGSLKPSESDKKLTEKLINSSKILNLGFIDHIIFTDDSYFSFTDNGFI
ncbi:MAG: DNA repair protein RadC [Flavobacteriia bacterium]|nr:DNA repair protein RadC [Flavobacteriia bacterium]